MRVKDLRLVLILVVMGAGAGSLLTWMVSFRAERPAPISFLRLGVAESARRATTNQEWLPWVRVEAVVRARFGAEFDEELNLRLKDYVAVHAAMVPGHNASRYVVFVADAEYGYGNRMQGLLSAFVYGLVSRRALLVHWPNQTNVPLRHLKPPHNAERATNIDHRHLFKAPAIHWDFGTHIQWVGGDRRVPWGAGFAESLVCRDPVSWKTGLRYLFLPRSWDFWGPLVLENVHVGDEWRDLWKRLRPRLFAMLAAYLFHPTDSVTRQATRCAPAGGCLGLHVRTHHPDIGMHPHFRREFMACLAHAAETLPVAHRILLATDDRDRCNHTLQELDADTIRQVDRCEHEDLARDSAAGAMASLVDMFALAACQDGLVMPHGTTYGRVAALLSGGRTRLWVAAANGTCLAADRPWVEPCCYMWDQVARVPCRPQLNARGQLVSYAIGPWWGNRACRIH